MTYQELSDVYRPVFAEIAAGALQRELDRELPHTAVELLKRSGFTGVRVPVEFGGRGASLPDMFRLLVDLAAADPHVPQALRGHLAFVEDRLNAPASVERDEWLTRFAAGELVGNAVTEIGSVALGDTTTRLTEHDGGYAITGRKYYTTGSIFAEWIDATALDPRRHRGRRPRRHRLRSRAGQRRLDRIRPAPHRQRHDGVLGRAGARRARLSLP